MLYSGDQDSVLPLTGTRTLVTGLAKDLGLNTTVPYGAWFEGRQVRNSNSNVNNVWLYVITKNMAFLQVGGWTQVYGEFLSFATIRGASHEAPFSQPERSLVLFSSFVEGKPLPRANAITKPRDSLTRLM